LQHLQEIISAAIENITQDEHSHPCEACSSSASQEIIKPNCLLPCVPSFSLLMLFQRC
jgi:hypothetical protein